MGDEDTWYSELREKYKPSKVDLLLIGESAPSSDESSRRFFYAPVLTQHDNLFRGVVLAMYDHRFPQGSSGSSKVPWLTRLKSDGIFLIDLVPYPVNGLDSNLRAKARKDAVADTVDRIRSLDPEGIVICHGPSHRVLRGPLTEAGLPLLHETPLPFPLGNWREAFALGFSEAWPDAQFASTSA